MRGGFSLFLTSRNHCHLHRIKTESHFFETPCFTLWGKDFREFDQH
jgi:hypothetical protein